MTKEQIEHYFDWAATSPSDEEILKEALSISLSCQANPSSLHTPGKLARTALENARKTAAEALSVKPETIFFTSGGTESNHIPLLSVLSKPNKGHVLISAIEHPAVREMALEMKKCGCDVEVIPSDSRGIITPEAVTSLIRPETAIVCVMAVNNETGAIQPIYEIADAITEATKGKRRPKFHTDCVQAAGKIPLNLNYPGIDSAAFSAHKICGPRGTGILYMKNPLDPFLRGGGQESGFRSGTENLFGALAFSMCLKKHFISDKNTFAKERFEEQKKLCHDFLKELSALPGASIIPQARLTNEELYSPWVIQVAFKNIPGQVMLRALDAEGFFISTGSACSAKKNNRPVLEAMHVTKDQSETAVRLSFGPLTTKKSMTELLAALSIINNKFNGK